MRSMRGGLAIMAGQLFVVACLLLIEIGGLARVVGATGLSLIALALLSWIGGQIWAVVSCYTGREALREWTFRHHWVFHNSVPGSWGALPQSSGPPPPHMDMEAQSVIDAASRDFTAFQTTWRCDTLGWRTGARLRTYVVATGRPCTPWLHVRRRHLSRIPRAEVGTRVTFESDEFNRKFEVWTDAPHFATDFLSQRHLRLLLDSRIEALTFRWGLVVVQYASVNTIRNIERRVQETTTIRDAVPDWAWHRWAVPV